MAIDLQAVGMIEFNSIAVGIEAADRMMKAAVVDTLFIKSICPGKYFVGINGDVSSVQASIDAGLERAQGALVDHLVIPNLNPAVIHAMSGNVEYAESPAIGVIETYSASSSIKAADIAIKAADINILEVRVAMGLGGKAYCLLSGEVATVELAVSAGASAVSDDGLLIRKAIIPNVSPEVMRHIA